MLYAEAVGIISPGSREPESTTPIHHPHAYLPPGIALYFQPAVSRRARGLASEGQSPFPPRLPPRPPRHHQRPAAHGAAVRRDSVPRKGCYGIFYREGLCESESGRDFFAVPEFT